MRTLQTPSTTLENYTCFDYDTQTWLKGLAAAEIGAKQLREELELLEGPKGADYCRMVGERDRPGRIEHNRVQLSRTLDLLYGGRPRGWDMAG